MEYYTNVNGILSIYIDCFNLSVEDWKCDQFHWRHYGRKKLQTSPVVTKTYYAFIAADGSEKTCFKRYVYTINGQSNYVLIHYKEDDSVAAGIKLHKRTCPSILRELEKTEIAPSVAYKKKLQLQLLHLNINWSSFQEIHNK